MSRKPPLIVTFSGPEGAGKTTQLRFVLDLCEECKMRPVAVRAADVGVSSVIASALDRLGLRKRQPRTYSVDLDVDRRQAEHSALEREDSKPSNRPRPRPAARHRVIDHVRTAPRRWRRIVTYVADAFVLRLHLRSIGRKAEADVVIMDRYIYDALVKIVAFNPRAARFIGRIARQPDLPFLLSVDPAEGVTRRPGSKLAYYESRNALFRRLAALRPELVPVPPGDLPTTQAFVRERVINALCCDLPAGFENASSPAITSEN